MYQPYYGELDCEPCPAGYHCMINSSVPEDCPAYHYCPEMSIGPTPCPDGSYTEPQVTNLQNGSQCQECPSGEGSQQDM